MVLTLVGMPGCGKSCMGRSLAQKLRMSHVDSDKLIERKVGMKLHEYISANGNDAFKVLEEQTLLSVFNHPNKDLILSTGGSAIYSEQGMEHLRSLGKIIYLYCSFETIVARLGDFSKRGVIMKPGQSLRNLYDERCALYEKYADITISCDGSDFARYQRLAVKTLKSALKYE